jgi:hypothetical protein
MVFGSAALAFVREELETGAGEFGGPLAARLLALELGSPFALLPSDTTLAARMERHPRYGGVDDGSSDRRLAIVISQWLEEADPGRRRLVRLEEPLARYGDPCVDPRSTHCGEHVYWAADRGAGPADVKRAFRKLAGYPGVGVLTRPPADAVISGALTDDAVQAMADAAVALLVRAWDDEAFLVVPVAGAGVSVDRWEVEGSLLQVTSAREEGLLEHIRTALDRYECDELSLRTLTSDVETCVHELLQESADAWLEELRTAWSGLEIVYAGQLAEDRSELDDEDRADIAASIAQIRSVLAAHGHLG